MGYRRIILSCVLLFWAAAAWSHAALVQSQPEQEALLEQVPEQLSLEFSEPVTVHQLQLTQPDGQIQTLDLPSNSRQLITTPWPQALANHAPSGSYLLSWRVISADGHPVGGSLLFSLGHVDPQAQQVNESTVDLGLASGIWLLRLIWLTSLIFIVGTAFFQAFWRSYQDRPYLLIITAGVGSAAAVGSLGLLGLDTLGLEISHLTMLHVWAVAVHTSFMATVALSITAMMLAVISQMTAIKGIARLLALIAVIDCLTALLVSGHVSTASPGWLAKSSLAVHVFAVLFWLGSLIPLFVALKKRNVRLLSIFSKAIPWLLVGLIVSGIIMAFVQLGQVSDLWQAAYGRVLLAKLALVAVLLMIGAANRYALTQAALAKQHDAITSLRRNVAIEIIVAVLILAVVALWRFTPPPRTMHVTPPAAVETTLQANSIETSVTFESSGNKQNLELNIKNSSGKAIATKQVKVAFSNAELGIEPMSFTAEQVAAGEWRVDDLSLPQIASWDIKVIVLISDFERKTLAGTIKRPE